MLKNKIKLLEPLNRLLLLKNTSRERFFLTNNPGCPRNYLLKPTKSNWPNISSCIIPQTTPNQLIGAHILNNKHACCPRILHNKADYFTTKPKYFYLVACVFLKLYRNNPLCPANTYRKPNKTACYTRSGSYFPRKHTQTQFIWENTCINPNKCA